MIFRSSFEPFFKRHYFIFIWLAQSELVFILEVGRIGNCAMLLLGIISLLEFW